MFHLLKVEPADCGNGWIPESASGYTMRVPQILAEKKGGDKDSQSLS